MKASVLAIGTMGARIAEALVHSAFCGAMPREDVLRVTLLYAPEEDVTHLRRLYGAYSDLRSGWGLNRHTGFTPILSLRTGGTDLPLNRLAEGAEDAALLRAVLPAREAAAPAMSASPRTAAMAWTAALRHPDPLMREVLADADAMPTLVCASLAEPCGAAGARLLLRELAGRGGAGAVLFTGWTQTDTPATARRALEAGDYPADFTALLGLPEDCRAPGSAPHLMHLLACRAVDAFLCGWKGRYAFRVPTRLDWTAFDPGGNRWGNCFDALLRFDALWQAVYAPEAARLLREDKTLRGRLTPWVGNCFPISQLSADGRDLAGHQVGCALLIAHHGAAFLRSVQASLPYVLRPSPSLDEMRAQAEEHYETVLKRAGLLSLLEYDIRQSAMAQVTTIHRHDMADTESETALRQKEELQEALEEELSVQAALDKPLGTRVRRSMMRAFADETAREAADVRAQAEEASRRIGKAAAIARPDEMPKVDQARARLKRMQRRVASLEGRAARAAADRDAAAAAEPIPVREDAAPAEVFWPAAWLDALCTLPRTDPKIRPRQAAAVLSTWPWTDRPARFVQDMTARAELPDVPPALRLIEALFRAVL